MPLPPGTERRYRAMLAEPLFRCRGGFRRGDTKVTLRTAERMIASGLAKRITSRKGTPMLVATRAERQAEPRQRPWWIEEEEG
jgi:hypothetical protein